MDRPRLRRDLRFSSRVRTKARRRMLVGIARRRSCACEDAMYDGISNFDATRALLSVPSGRGHLTRFQRCWRYGAALDVWIWSLSSEGPRTPDVLAGGTTSQSCRRTPRVSPLLQFGATLRFASGQALRLRSPFPQRRTRCELRAESLAFPHEFPRNTPFAILRSVPGAGVGGGGLPPIR